MKYTIQVKVIDPMGNKVTVTERVGSNHPVCEAFNAYREKHKGNFPHGSEFQLIGEGSW